MTTSGEVLNEATADTTQGFAPKIRVETNHNVYIFGAGFSVEAGVPIVRDFLNATRDSLGWLEGQVGRESEVRAVREVLRFRLSAAAAADRINLNVEDIEELFSLASATPGFEVARDVTAAIAATIDYCRVTHAQRADKPRLNVNVDVSQCPTALQPFVKGKEQWHNVDLYPFLAAVIAGALTPPRSDMRNTVITFNYDTVLEDALKAIGVPFGYGFRAEGDSFSDPSSPLQVLKLHGSVNWGTPTPLGALLRGDVAFVPREDYTSVRHNGESVALVPPTWRKQFGRGLDKVWDAAVDALRTATRIIVIGFSLPPTDTHFKYLLAAGLRDNISLRQIFYVNPDPDQEALAKRLFSVLREDLYARGTVRLIQADARSFLKSDANLRQIGRTYSPVIHGVG